MVIVFVRLLDVLHVSPLTNGSWMRDWDLNLRTTHGNKDYVLCFSYDKYPWYFRRYQAPYSFLCRELVSTFGWLGSQWGSWGLQPVGPWPAADPRVAAPGCVFVCADAGAQLYIGNGAVTAPAQRTDKTAAQPPHTVRCRSVRCSPKSLLCCSV